MIEIAKVNLLCIGAVMLSYVDDIDFGLKTLAVCVTIGYNAHKWYILSRNASKRRKSESNKG